MKPLRDVAERRAADPVMNDTRDPEQGFAVELAGLLVTPKVLEQIAPRGLDRGEASAVLDGSSEVAEQALDMTAEAAAGFELQRFVW